MNNKAFEKGMMQKIAEDYGMDEMQYMLPDEGASEPEAAPIPEAPKAPEAPQQEEQESEAVDLTPEQYMRC